MGIFQKRRRRASFLLWLLLLLALLYLIQQPFRNNDPSWPVAVLMTISMVAFWLVCAGVVVYQLTVWIMHGERCPGCLKGGMKRVGMISFGPRYYLCNHCGHAWQRTMLGVWEELDEKDLAELQASHPAADPIGPEPWEPAKTDPAGHAVDSLVLSQRRRKEGD